MNKVILTGRLTKNPELRYTSSNIPTATFSLVVDRQFTNQNGEREADFINIVVWKNQAENCHKYLTKGSQCAVEGRIQTRSYDDQNGQKRYVTEVVADRVEFLNTKKEGQASGQVSEQVSATQNDTQVPQTNPYEEMSKQVSLDDYPVEVTDDEMPF